jgi:hypothetical protein
MHWIFITRFGPRVPDLLVVRSRDKNIGYAEVTMAVETREKSSLDGKG